MLGEYYFERSFLPKDLTNAIYWYEKAANGPDGYYASRAQFQLGYIHATETKNFTEAAKWFRKLAEAGNPYAQGNLANLHYKGLGVERDWKEAAVWYRKAAESGNAEAQVNLAAMYRDGEGVPQDFAEAVK